MLLAKGPLKESVDQEIARQNRDGEEYVERHNEFIVPFGMWGSPEQFVSDLLGLRRPKNRAFLLEPPDISNHLRHDGN
jgi:hypothetical protein